MLAQRPQSKAFLGYNKKDGYVPTLVGNWVEERYLAERTGVHRLKTWATATPSNSVYAEKAGGATDLDTLPRTLEHDDQYLSAEWLSTGTVVHQPPSNRVGDLVTFKNIPSSGPREAAEMAQLLSIAETMVPKPPPPFKELTSTHRQDFVQHDTSGIVYVPRPGRVQMMTQDRGPVSRDKTFLSEEKLLAQHTAGRFVGGKKPLERTLGNLPKEVPITIYSEALTKGSYNSTQYGSKHYGSSTFGKHSNFTKPVGDFTKDTSDE